MNFAEFPNLNSEENSEPTPSELEEKPMKKTSQVLKTLVAMGSAMMLTSSEHRQDEHLSFEELRDRAKKEMSEQGITSEQRLAYTNGVSDKIYSRIGPMAVTPSSPEEWIQLLGGRKELDTWGQFENNPGEEDAWRLYLGMPQKYNTFAISDFKPASSIQEKYYFKINGFKDSMFKDWYENNSQGKDISEIEKDRMRSIVASMPEENMIYDMTSMMTSSKVMGHFQGSRGQDDKGHYISYYDIYDFSVPGSSLIGKPFEIYDRIYYDPNTFEILE